jgi:hypothetical protein
LSGTLTDPLPHIPQIHCPTFRIRRH